MNFLDRIDDYRKRHGNMSQTVFEKTAGLSPGQMTKWRHQGFMPNHASQLKIAAVLGITIEELMRVTDDNEPDRSDGSVLSACNVAQSPSVYVYEGSDPEALKSGSHDESSEPVKILPCSYAADDEYFAIKITDDSMHPDMRSGDIAVARIQSEAENGDLVIVFTPGDPVICRKYVSGSRGMILEALNRSYDPIYYSWNDVDILPVQITGKVVSVIRYYE